MGDITPESDDQYFPSYYFLDSNGWPISSEQEVHFTVLDLLSHGCVHIFFKTKHIPRFDVPIVTGDTVDGFKAPLPANNNYM